MRVYLDTCCLQRPLDDKSQPRIRHEANAVLAILDYLQVHYVQLAVSEVLVYEIERNRDPKRRDFGLGIVELASSAIDLDALIIHRARYLNQNGIASLDSLHLASAEAGRVAYFCTCDDTFYRKAKRLAHRNIQVVSPCELTEILQNDSPSPFSK